MGADGDFLAVDREGFVAPLADRGHRGVGKVGVAAYGGDLLDAAVGVDQGFEYDRSLDVGAARGFGVFRFDALVEQALGGFRLQANEAVVDGRLRVEGQVRDLGG